MEGGAIGDGTVFELAKGSSTITTLASFNGTNGANPEAGLIMDSSGNLYGTTVWRMAATTATAPFSRYYHTRRADLELPAPITYGTALSSTQLDASAADSVTGAAVAGTFVYTPAAGTILHAGNQTLSVTFTPTDTTDYSPITTDYVARWSIQATPVLTWNTPAPITYGTPLSSTQLDATAADPNTGSAVSGTLCLHARDRHDSRPRQQPLERDLYAHRHDRLHHAPGERDAGGHPLLCVDDAGVSTAPTGQPVAGADHGQQRQSLWHNRIGRRQQRRHRFRARQGKQHHHHPGFVQRHQRRRPSGRPDHGQQRQSLWHDRVWRRQTATARFSSWPMAAAPSPRWLRSTAPTVSDPYAGLIMDSSGNLYGTTESGGADGDGTVFELAKGSGTITTLASFNGTNGEIPMAG